MIDINRFIELYTVKYGDFPCDTGSAIQMQEWRRVLSGLPENQLETFFAHLNGILGSSIKKPRTREVERALARMEKDDRPDRRINGLEGCGMCFGTGVFTAWITLRRDGTKALGLDGEGLPYEIGYPCKCSRGRYLRHSFPNLTDEQQDAAFQWLVLQADIAKSEGVRLSRYLRNKTRAMFASWSGKREAVHKKARCMAWLDQLKQEAKEKADGRTYGDSGQRRIGRRAEA
jgi:hypothetical protein